MDSQFLDMTSTDTIKLHIPKEPALRVQLLAPFAQLPTKAHPYEDLGYDLYALEDVDLAPQSVTKIRTGIACNFPPGMGALLRDRSSVATKQHLFVVAGVIDQGYTGEILVAMYNPGDFERFRAGDKIAQMILIPVVTYPVFEVLELDNTERGAKGFGSSGR